MRLVSAFAFFVCAAVSGAAANNDNEPKLGLRGREAEAAQSRMLTSDGDLEPVQEVFWDKQLRNGLNKSVCLDYNDATSELTVQLCPFGADSVADNQLWGDTIYGNLGFSRTCLAPRRGDGSSNYDSLVVVDLEVDDLSSCAKFEYTADGKIYTDYADGTRMYIGISGSCHITPYLYPFPAMLHDVVGSRVELQKSDFPQSRPCGAAQQWYRTAYTP